MPKPRKRAPERRSLDEEHLRISRWQLRQLILRREDINLAIEALERIVCREEEKLGEAFAGSLGARRRKP